LQEAHFTSKDALIISAVEKHGGSKESVMAEPYRLKIIQYPHLQTEVFCWDDVPVIEFLYPVEQSFDGNKIKTSQKYRML